MVFGPDFVVSSSHMLLTPLSKKMPFSGFVRIFRLRNKNQRKDDDQTQDKPKQTKTTTYANKLLFLSSWTAVHKVALLRECFGPIHPLAFRKSRAASCSILCQQLWAQKQDACGLRLSSSYKTHNEKFGCLIGFFGHFWPLLTG